MGNEKLEIGALSARQIEDLELFSHDPLVAEIVAQEDAGMVHSIGRNYREIVGTTFAYGVPLLAIEAACDMYRLRRDIEGADG